MTFQCQVPGCGQTFDNQTEIRVHISYHEYHLKIKEAGRKEIARLSERLDMVISCPFVDRLVGSDYLPQLPTRLVCEWHDCEAEFTSAEKYYSHVSHHAHRLVDKCYWSKCYKTFKNVTLTLLRDHLRVHTLQKLYACPHCGNFFSTKTKFDDHFLRHLSETDFLANKDDLAPEEIAQNGGELPHDLELYKINEQEVEIFRCKFERCNKTFLTASLLREHQRIHSGKNQCDQCSYRATTASCLESHKLYRHQTERLFECTICHKTFKQRSDLRAHVRRHQIVEPYRCDKCDFETLNEDGLVKHSRLHDNLTYLCHVCKRTFNRGNNLSRHLKDMHQIEPAEGSSRFKYKLSSQGVYLVESIDEDQVVVEGGFSNQFNLSQSTLSHGLGASR